MSYIAPDSDVYILRDCPLTPAYKHTYFFEDDESQESYFMSQSVWTLSAQSYQRVHKGTMRVQITAKNLYRCNYMMFRNTAFETKWFYAFITNVEYINNVTSEITYEIDVMQTWLNDYTLAMCLVEREHTATDVIGEHILPEGIECGEYVSNTEGQILSTSSCYTVAEIANPDEGGTWYHDGLLQGVTLKAFNSSLDYDTMYKLIETYINDPDQIVSMYTVPKEAIEDSGVSISSDGTLGSNNVYTFKYTATAVSSSDSLDGYKPKNKKLYTYPYNFYRVITPDGSSLVTRYEFCTNLQPQYEISIPLTQPVNVVCRPINYKGCSMGNSGESITLSSYPLIAWSYDAYEAYIAQNSVTSGLGYGFRIGEMALGGLTGNVGMMAGGATGLAEYALSRLQTNYKASIAADPVKGSISSGNVDIGAKHQTFYTNRMSVSYEYAKQIDNYFTMFGYAVNELKVPNRTARPYYTYIKTANCKINGYVPADDKARIESIYDSGITWWKSGTTIGDYSVNNTV